jgi:hypothetical protein
MKSHEETETTIGTISVYQETRQELKSEEEKAETFTMHFFKIFKREITLTKENNSDSF